MKVRQIRESLQMSQEEFAEFFDFDLTTLQAWEQGRLVPTGVSRNFPILLQRNPEGMIAALSSPDE
jgi:putative transcriptional regulator